MSTVRQRWLSAAAAVLAILGTGVNHAKAEDTIKIGILHSLSGTMAISETILKDLLLMEVAEVNAKGGLLGKKIEPVVVEDVKLPWYVDLLNINLDNHDLAEAKRRIRLLTEAFRRNGTRITENLDFG